MGLRVCRALGLRAIGIMVSFLKRSPVRDLLFSVWGAGFRVRALGFRVWGLGFGAYGSGFGFYRQPLEADRGPALKSTSGCANPLSEVCKLATEPWATGPFLVHTSVEVRRKQCPLTALRGHERGRTADASHSRNKIQHWGRVHHTRPWKRGVTHRTPKPVPALPDGVTACRAARAAPVQAAFQMSTKCLWVRNVNPVALVP